MAAFLPLLGRMAASLVGRTGSMAARGANFLRTGSMARGVGMARGAGGAAGIGGLRGMAGRFLGGVMRGAGGVDGGGASSGPPPLPNRGGFAPSSPVSVTPPPLPGQGGGTQGAQGAAGGSGQGGAGGQPPRGPQGGAGGRGGAGGAGGQGGRGGQGGAGSRGPQGPPGSGSGGGGGQNVPPMSGGQRFMAGLLASMSMRGGLTGSVGRIGGAALLQSRGANLGAGTIGALVPDFINLGRAVTGLPSKIESMGASLIQVQNRLAIASGVIATALVQLDADRFRRDVRSGNKTGESLTFASRQQSRLEDATEPWKALITNIENRVIGSLAMVSASVMEKVNNAGATIIDGINAAIPGVAMDIKNVFKDDPNEKNKDILSDFVNDVARGKYSGRKWKPLKKNKDDN